MRGILSIALTGGLLVSLSGCGVTGWQPRPVPFVEPGAELALRQPVTFPAGTTRVFFQGGRMTDARGIAVWEHHCALALDHAFDTDVSVPAGRIPVASTQRRTVFGAASRGVVVYENNFLFAATARPLYALYCEIWVLGDSLHERHHLDAAGLARVLGETAELRPAQARNRAITH